MKKFVFLLILLPFLFSCSKKESSSSKSIILSGKIKNFSKPEIYLRSGNEVIDTIKLDTSGAFVDTLQLDQGFYSLSIDRHYVGVYMKPGMKIKLEADFGKIPQIVLFSGDAKDENNFLVKKDSLMKALSRKYNFSTLALLDEQKFLHTEDSLMNIRLDFLTKNYKGNDSFFEKYIQKEDSLNKDYYVYYYAEAKKYYGGDTAFKVSADYPDVFKQIDMNDSDFASNSTFLNMLSDYFSKKLGNDSGSYYIDEVELIDSSITNPKVKENLVYSIAKENMLNTKHLDEFYNKIDKLINDRFKKLELKGLYDNMQKIAKGQECPDFSFTGLDGKEYSLNSFKGKIIFFDFWAVWCHPCVHQIPYLEKLKKRFRGKDIVFASVDVADPINQWKSFVAKRHLTDLQLHTDSWNNAFLRRFMVDWIPRFIIIGKDGKIIDNNSIRPSNPKLVDKLNKLLEK